MLALETNMFCAGEEQFLSRQERDQNMRSNFSHTHPATCVATNDFQTECQDDCYSQVLTSESRWHHALILTSEDDW